MSRTVTAFYDNFVDAETALTHLVDAGLHLRSTDIIGPAENAEPEQHRGFWAKLGELFMPDEDRHAYLEGVRRGGYLVVADVGEDEADRAIRVLDDSNSVDLDTRRNEWEREGWTGIATTPQTGAFGHIGDDWPENRAGRRDTERSGSRVRSYVREGTDEQAG